MAFSKKQLQVLMFPKSKYQAIICDGAIRSGKTAVMSLSFVLWAMHTFNGHNLAICGKTVQSCVRNVIQPLLGVTYFRRYGFRLYYSVANHCLTVSRGGIINRFYVFGGKDESSASLIQGVTLAGILLDEVALMPRSFVEQALARCSVEGARFWFNCNPESPRHWFYTEWILQAKKHRALHLHFLMRDNPSLSPSVLQRYEDMYSGVFYDRFIRGEWVVAEGLIYPMFSTANITADVPAGGMYCISVDYGTVNAFSAGLWCVSNGVAVRIREYYHSGRDTGDRLTDEEYYAALERLAGGLPIRHIIVDPSAASFKACIKRHGRYRAKDADNEVLNGIRNVATLLRAGRILIHRDCTSCIGEFELYRWDEKSAKDKPLKENDHAMDELRYFVNTALKKWLRHEVAI